VHLRFKIFQAFYFRLLFSRVLLNHFSISTHFLQEMQFFLLFFFFFRTCFGLLLLLHTFSYRNHSNIKMFSSLRTRVLVFNFLLPFILFKILSFFQNIFQCKSKERIFKSSLTYSTLKYYFFSILSATDSV